MQPTVPPHRSKLFRLLGETAPGRVIRQVARSPEYGVLYSGIAFWVIAGTIGIGRPLFAILTHT